MNKTVAVDDLDALVGQEVGVSDWFTVDQDRIDQFADVTEDPQFIHIDPVRAKAAPFGGTIAHGFLSLSLLSRMAVDAAITLEGMTMAINYGFDKIRFVAPVLSASRVRGRFVLQEASARAPGEMMLRYLVTVDIEDHDKPALVANWLTLQMLGST